MKNTLVTVPYVFQNNGIVSVDLSSTNGQMEKIADFFQKLVYFTASKYLDKTIRHELGSENVIRRGESHFFTIEFLHTALVVYNSGFSDDCLFDKEDLSGLIKDLRPHIVSGEPRTYYLCLMKMFLTIKPLENNLFLFCFHYNDEGKTLSPIVQNVLKEVLDTISNLRGL